MKVTFFFLFFFYSKAHTPSFPQKYKHTPTNILALGGKRNRNVLIDYFLHSDPGRVQVFVRLRPLSEIEQLNNYSIALSIPDPERTQVTFSNYHRHFTSTTSYSK